MKNIKMNIFAALVFSSIGTSALATVTYPIVDTSQTKFFNDRSEITRPLPEEGYYGQDAEFTGNSPSYTRIEEGIKDNVTGLTWEKGYRTVTYSEALEELEKLNSNIENPEERWRIPTIKEAYSLIDFSGKDVSGRDMKNVPDNAVPFIDTDYFDFEYGSNGERIIDVQILTSTKYKGLTMGRNTTFFGLNIADGRIKGYPVETRGREKGYTVRFVKGNPQYGINDFTDNGDQTVTDRATNLMWSKDDSKEPMDWKVALEWAADKNEENYLGYSDWRLPNAKELQSIVDYNNSPQETSSPAIDSIFNTTKIIREDNREGYAFYWTSTTHENMRGGSEAVYISFGESLGYFKSPNSDKTQLLDVHGAGAQRSDPKTGNAGRYPKGRGPQGDVIRIDNMVRLVRDAD